MRTNITQQALRAFCLFFSEKIVLRMIILLPVNNKILHVEFYVRSFLLHAVSQRLNFDLRSLQ